MNFVQSAVLILYYKLFFGHVNNNYIFFFLVWASEKNWGVFSLLKYGLHIVPVS